MQPIETELTPQQTRQVDERIQKAYAAQYALQGLVPTYHSHCCRNDFNVAPKDKLEWIDVKINRGRTTRQAYFDSATQTKWFVQPWYLSMFHNPAKNYKLVCYDDDALQQAPGSSEIIVPKSAHNTKEGTIDIANMRQGSYNYRAKGIKHYLADVLPVVAYFKRIGQ